MSFSEDYNDRYNPKGKSDNELLKECINALNQIPNTKLNNRFKDTYSLLSYITKEQNKRKA